MRDFLRRIFISGYGRHTMSVKWKAARIKAKIGGRPFDHFDKDVQKQNIERTGFLSVEAPNYKPQYYSFAYFDSDTAGRYYADSPTVIHRVMQAIILCNDCLDSDSCTQVESEILSQADQIIAEGTWRDGGLYFFTLESYSKFDLSGERYSGILQAKAASLFIRCHHLSGEEKYRVAARAALLACSISTDEGGVARHLSDGLLWIEEYVSPSPSMVLNGFVFVVIALAEYAALYDDHEIAEIYQRCFVTLITWLPYYRVGDDVLYSMYHWDMANVHYLGVQTYQMEHLHQLTENEEVGQFAQFLRRRTDWRIFDLLIRR